MLMTRILRFRRLVIAGLLPFVAALLLHAPARAGVPPQDPPQGTNVRWAVKDDVIVINYDLKIDPDLKCNVDIVMKRENDPEFSAEPVTVEGDIGGGYFAGSNREIRWYFRRDYPQGFLGEGYYFEIEVKPIGKESKWLYYTIGAAAVVGGVLAFLVSKNQEELPPGGIPLPPGRP